jgi:mono/diheme cytochrome c family protein
VRGPGIPHRHKALFIALGAGVLVVLGGIAAMVILLSGAYSTAATKQHFWITYRLLEVGLRFSVAAAADEITVPDLKRVADLNEGVACYREHCVQCHGAPGVPPAALGMGELPSPSSLPQSAREWPEAELYYVVQKGIRMSGMPAWEYRISDDALWSTVAFIKTMPFQTRASYERMAQASADARCPKPNKAQPYSLEQAQITLRQYACDTCHVIPQLVGPNTHVGPPLTQFYRRKFIGGVLPNTHDNLVRWIVDPQAISPHSLMPNLGVTEPHAHTMARYLLQQSE